MCTNRNCPHSTIINKRGAATTANGCDIFVGVNCTKCRDFRP